MIIPGLVSVTCKRSRAEDVIHLAKSMGLTAMEWSENWHVRPDDLQRVREIGELTRSAGLAVAGYGSYFRLGTDMDPLPSIRAAAQLQAPLIRIWGGDKPSSEIGNEAYSLMVDEAVTVADLALEHQMDVALEWHKNTITDTNETASKFLKDVGRANFKTLWQPHQNQSVHQRLQGLYDVKHCVAHLHVYHWDQTGRRPLAEGSEDWLQYLSCFSTSQSLFALLEFVKDDSDEQLAADARTLVAWTEKMNRIGERNG